MIEKPDQNYRDLLHAEMEEDKVKHLREIQARIWEVNYEIIECEKRLASACKEGAELQGMFMNLLDVLGMK